METNMHDEAKDWNWGRRARKKLEFLLGIGYLCEHTFYSGYLNDESTVLDLGGHLGQFTKEIVREFGSKCYLYEPNSELFALIPEGKNSVNINEAVSDIDGVADFVVCKENDSSYLGDSKKDDDETVKVRVTSLENVIKKHNLKSLDLLKMDIEGAEIPVLLGTPEAVLKSIGQITVEFHDFIYPKHIVKIDAVKKRMREMGFIGFNMTPPYHGDYVFINLKRLKLPLRVRSYWFFWTTLMRIRSYWFFLLGPIRKIVAKAKG